MLHSCCCYILLAFFPPSSLPLSFLNLKQVLSLNLQLIWNEARLSMSLKILIWAQRGQKLSQNWQIRNCLSYSIPNLRQDGLLSCCFNFATLLWFFGTTFDSLYFFLNSTKGLLNAVRHCRVGFSSSSEEEFGVSRRWRQKSNRGNVFTTPQKEESKFSAATFFEPTRYAFGGVVYINSPFSRVISLSRGAI